MRPSRTSTFIFNFLLLFRRVAALTNSHDLLPLPQYLDTRAAQSDAGPLIVDANLTQLVSRGLAVGMCDKHTPCTNKACCGPDGRCGYSPDQCGKGCRFNCNAKAQCGRYAPAGSQKCPLNVCCSEFGFCGSTDDFCKHKKCDTKYGGCGEPKRPTCRKGDSVSGRTIGYYESWSDTRKCQKVEPEDLNVSSLTHINFAFSFFDPATFQIADMDDNSGKLYNRFTALKSKSPKLKTWISVGGWSFTESGPTRHAFSNMVSTASNRKKFIHGLMQFMRRFGFDGVDLDWEYPVAADRGGKPNDKANYVLLTKEMKVAFHGKFGISMTLPTSFWYLQHFDLIGIQDSVDWFNLMSYDLHGVWDKSSKFVGPYVAPHTNQTEIDLGLDLLWRAGVNPAKVSMGLGFYGRSFTLENANCNKPNGVCKYSGGGNAGACSNSSGILDIQEVNHIIRKNNLTPKYNKKANVKWVTWDKDQWVSFDDKETIKHKKDFANRRCLGGSMIWAMDQANQSSIAPLLSARQRMIRQNLEATPERALRATELQSQLSAVTDCYTSGCSEKCKHGYHEIATMTGQTTDVNTDSCPKGPKGNQEHKSLCCPRGATTDNCGWRGYRGVGLPCSGYCINRQTLMGQNTNSIDGNDKVGPGQTCTGGLQSYCCQNYEKATSIGEDIKNDIVNTGKIFWEEIQGVGEAIGDAFKEFGDEIFDLATGVLIDLAGKAICRVAIPGLMGLLEAAEVSIPVAGEVADAAEIAATPAVVQTCSELMDRATKAIKGRLSKLNPDLAGKIQLPKAIDAPPKDVPETPKPKKGDGEVGCDKVKRANAGSQCTQPNSAPANPAPANPAPANAPPPKPPNANPPKQPKTGPKPQKPARATNDPSFKDPISPPPNEHEIPNSVRCGGTRSYSKQDIINAMNQGLRYKLSSRGPNAKAHPDTPWQTGGDRFYPHTYFGSELNVPKPSGSGMWVTLSRDSHCSNAHNANVANPTPGGGLLEFPILRSGAIYDASQNNKGMAELDRIIFVQEPNAVAPVYCGIMSHEGAASQWDFVDCK